VINSTMKLMNYLSNLVLAFWLCLQQDSRDTVPYFLYNIRIPIK
jgi:hypothetical protein